MSMSKRIYVGGVGGIGGWVENGVGDGRGGEREKGGPRGKTYIHDTVLHFVVKFIRIAHGRRTFELHQFFLFKIK